MILTDIDDMRHTGVIVLRPNNSWSWRANVLFLTAFMVLSLVISTGFLMAGAWVILPFSLLEIIIVGSCIYYSVNQCSRQEVITVTDHEVKIEADEIVAEEAQKAWEEAERNDPELIEAGVERLGDLVGTGHFGGRTPEN